MASPTQLIEAVANALNVPKVTIFQHDRFLVTAGYRKVSGRGRAAKVTPQDASALLIVVAASPISGPTVKASVASFESYNCLFASDSDTQEATSWAALKILQDLPKGHTLHEAISAIIVLLARGLPAHGGDIFENVPTLVAQGPYDLDFAISFEAPLPMARIRIYANIYDPHSDQPERAEQMTSEILYRPTASMMASYLDDQSEIFPGVHVISDFKQVRSFGIFTLQKIARIFEVRATE